MQFQLPPEEEGCFVFQVTNSPVCARSQPNVLAEDRTRLEFEVGELVSIDLVQHSSDNDNGPYLRLTDRSGWLFVKCMGQERMKKLDVERGLWAMYVDNVPNGQFLRRHPVVSPDLDLEIDGDNIRYEPGTKLFCDARVYHPSTGIAFFRVQGTRGWIFDHVPRKSDGVMARTMLLDRDKVRLGLFCYKAVEDVVIRFKPSIDESSMTREIIKAGQIVAVDCIREDPENTESGPFLRLTDGIGWLFEKKQGTTMMQNLPVEVGSWLLKILNPPVGVGLRRHPIVCQDKLYPVVYPSGSMVQCDRRVMGGDGTATFYHVNDTRGWVFDRRGVNMMLELVSFDTSIKLSMHQPWEPNFVRGIAATVDNLEEREQDSISDPSGALAFESTNDNDGGLVVYVYCKTRTVAVVDHERPVICESNCTTKRLLALFSGKTAATIETTESLQTTEQTPPDEAVPLHTKNPITLTLSASRGDDVLEDRSMGVEIVTLRDNVPQIEPSPTERCEKELPETDEKQENLEYEEDESVGDLLSETDTTEITLRKHLMYLEKVDCETQKKRLALIAKLKSFDDERAAEAARFKQLSNERLNEMKVQEQELVGMEEPVKDSGIPVLDMLDRDPEPIDACYQGKTDTHSRVNAKSPRSQTSSKAHRSSKSHRDPRKRGFQCGECDEIFHKLEDREDHCRCVHDIECEVCERVFKSFRALDLHKDKEMHW